MSTVRKGYHFSLDERKLWEGYHRPQQPWQQQHRWEPYVWGHNKSFTHEAESNNSKFYIKNSSFLFHSQQKSHLETENWCIF
jgi:hypothetical protein